MKKAISLLLALIMCVGLGVPAFAHPVDVPDADTAVSVESPQYAVYKMSFRMYIGSLTYADMVFTISEKGGHPAFENLDSVSFNVIDTSGVYWEVTGYSYNLTGDECTLYVSRTEMFAGAPTGYSDKATFKIPIEFVVGSTRESGPAIASSVNVVVE